MERTEFDCEYNVKCKEGPTCSAYIAEGRAFECKRSYQDVYDMEYKCDCQYTEGYKSWLNEECRLCNIPRYNHDIVNHPFNGIIGG